MQFREASTASMHRQHTRCKTSSLIWPIHGSKHQHSQQICAVPWILLSMPRPAACSWCSLPLCTQQGLHYLKHHCGLLVLRLSFINMDAGHSAKPTSAMNLTNPTNYFNELPIEARLLLRTLQCIVALMVLFANSMCRQHNISLPSSQPTKKSVPSV